MENRFVSCVHTRNDIVPLPSHSFQAEKNRPEGRIVSPFPEDFDAHLDLLRPSEHLDFDECLALVAVDFAD